MGRVLFHGGQVFDAVGAAPDAKPADIVVEDGRIVAVGPGLDGDDAVDCAGKTLIPGLFDCHVHVMATLVAPRGVLDAAAAGANIADHSLRKAEMVIEAHDDSISRAIAAGVKVAMGTDSAVTPHGQNLRELALMAERGMTPTQALVATSRTAAELMGLDGELGTLEPGKRADIVVVDGDPLELDKLPDRIAAVYKDGELAVDRSSDAG